MAQSYELSGDLEPPWKREITGTFRDTHKPLFRQTIGPHHRNMQSPGDIHGKGKTLGAR
jgi:hypothetical protein